MLLPGSLGDGDGTESSMGMSPSPSGISAGGGGGGGGGVDLCRLEGEVPPSLVPSTFRVPSRFRLSEASSSSKGEGEAAASSLSVSSASGVGVASWDFVGLRFSRVSYLSAALSKNDLQ